MLSAHNSCRAEYSDTVALYAMMVMPRRSANATGGPSAALAIAKSLGCNWAFGPFFSQHSACLRSRLTEEALWQGTSIICDLNYTENVGNGFGCGSGYSF